MAKSFSTIDHKISISKLKSYNIKGAMLNSLKDYLKDRSQSAVMWNCECWNTTRFLFGSFTVSCVYKLYFSSTELDMRLFADDAYLSYQHSNPEYLNEIINK